VPEPTSATVRPTVCVQWPQPGHGRLLLDRPAARNALGQAELVGLARAVEELQDGAPRVVSIVAEGPSFCVGGDIQDFGRALTDGGMAQWLRNGGRALNSAIARLHALDAAIVVGVQGAAAGGGLGLVLIGDMVVAADDLKLNIAYARIGASPDAGLSWFLRRLLTHPKAFELMALCPTLDARQALELNLVNRVVAPARLRQEVDALVQELLQVPPQSLRNIKRLLRQSPQTSLETQLHHEIEAFVQAVGQPEFAERVTAFLGRSSAR